MKFSFASLVTKLTLATSVAGALVGCDEPTYPTPSPVTVSTVGQAQVLVVNASPGSQGVTTTLENLPFGTVTPYLGSPVATYSPVNAGSRLFVFNDPANIPATPAAATAAGVAPLTAARPITARLPFQGGTNYTVFLTDAPTRAYVYPVTGTSDQGGIRTLSLFDNLSAPAVATNARVRFVNLASTGTYGIYNSLTQAPLFSAVPLRAYRAVNATVGTTTTTFANFTEVPAATYTLDVRSVATTPIAGTQRGLTFAAGKSYTLYVRGIAGNATTPLGISVVQHN
ncbi:DUF4397 domain-containing protein [Hymenobacter rubripertinctus]|uniref:DUF4397 domain-containing protein n=1 Tax=Hymenobacter rubripertinctus TaxID=2029981 RepID=A0A418QR66_9BACT|nr:DUF4397 domain-containing protein [Hymenobacter rubripertinctus]RIY07592.1 DUF4397 domain-containing protein [Hymenobacter rubripertinctus]